MADPRHTTLSDLANLFDPEFVQNQKINTIKIVRGITGKGLKETKNWVEQFLQPVVAQMTQEQILKQSDEPTFDPTEILKRLEKLSEDVDQLKRERTMNRAKGILDD